MFYVSYYELTTGMTASITAGADNEDFIRITQVVLLGGQLFWRLCTMHKKKRGKCTCRACSERLLLKAVHQSSDEAKVRSHAESNR